MQYNAKVGNWFPSQCLPCENQGRIRSPYLTHKVESIQNALVALGMASNHDNNDGDDEQCIVENRQSAIKCPCGGKLTVDYNHLDTRDGVSHIPGYCDQCKERVSVAVERISASDDDATVRKAKKRVKDLEDRVNQLEKDLENTKRAKTSDQPDQPDQPSPSDPSDVSDPMDVLDLGPVQPPQVATKPCSPGY